MAVAQSRADAARCFGVNSTQPYTQGMNRANAHTIRSVFGIGLDHYARSISQKPQDVTLAIGQEGTGASRQRVVGDE